MNIKVTVHLMVIMWGSKQTKEKGKIRKMLFSNVQYQIKMHDNYSKSLLYYIA